MHFFHLSATPCLEGPPRAEAAHDVEQLQYRNRLHHLGKLINQLVSAVLSGNTTLAAEIRRKIDLLVPVINAIKGRLLLSGRYKWSCSSTVFFGIRLPEHVMKIINFDTKLLKNTAS